jgi:hypothetical protein
MDNRTDREHKVSSLDACGVHHGVWSSRYCTSVCARGGIDGALVDLGIPWILYHPLQCKSSA